MSCSCFPLHRSFGIQFTSGARFPFHGTMNSSYLPSNDTVELARGRIHAAGGLSLHFLLLRIYGSSTFSRLPIMRFPYALFRPHKCFIDEPTRVVIINPCDIIYIYIYICNSVVDIVIILPMNQKSDDNTKERANPL